MTAPTRKKRAAPKKVEPVYGSIGEVTRFIRVRRGMTQQALARILGVSRTSVVNFEAGNQRFPLHRIPELAWALGTSPRRLLQELL